MAVLRGPEIVEAVRQGQRLGIGQLLAHLLDAAVDVAAVNVEFADDLAFERHAETQHAVRRRVLRADVDDVLVLLEEHVALADIAAVGLQFVGRRAVLRHLVAHAQGVLRRVVILAQGVSRPVVAQEQAPHVGMVQEADAEIVERLAFVQLGGLPQVAHRGQHRTLAVGGQRPQHDVLARRGRFKMIDHAEALPAPVHTREAAQEVEPVGPQTPGQVVKAVRRNGEHPVAAFGPYGAGLPGRNLVQEVVIHVFLLLPH